MRSGVSSMGARAVGYSIAAGCVALFGYMATIALTVYIWRQPHTGGYALLGVASLISSFFWMMAILPFAAF